MAADAKTLLLAPLLRDGIANAELLANEQYQLLRSNHLLDDTGRHRTAKPKTTTPRRDCREHPGTETPGGVCPSCGPKEG